MSAAAAGLPAFTSAALVRLVLVELAKRGALPTFGPATLPKAQEAAARLLWAMGVEDQADPLAEVVDLAAYRAALGGGRDARA